MTVGNSRNLKDRTPLLVLRGPLDPWNFPSSLLNDYQLECNILFYNWYARNVLTNSMECTGSK